MKIFLSVIICMIAACKTFAQEASDVLRYSWFTQNGTARSRAIGGAGTALGGEFSTLFNNPAGLGFYRTNEMVFTPGFSFQRNRNNYKSELTKTQKDYFNFGATGAILAFAPRYSELVTNYTIGLGIIRSADFNSDISYKALNKLSSFSEKYVEELFYQNGQNLPGAANNFPYGSSVAFRAKLVDTIRDVSDGSIAGYRSLVPLFSGVNQEHSEKTRGGITDIALGGAVNLQDKFYLGATATLPILNYNRTIVHRETDASSNTGNDFNYFEATESLKTFGYGLNVKVGAIYKPVEYVRLGLTFHSPTYYELTDTYSTSIETDMEGYGGAGVKKVSTQDINNGAAGKTKYNLITPWRIILGGSYVFREIEDVKKQRGFVTADIEYVNYRSSKFKQYEQSDMDAFDYYNDVNNTIKNQYRGALNFRLGGELKFNTLMVRLGGAYYSNPYKYDKGHKINVSGGLGYRNKGFFADLTYSYNMTKDVNYPYRLQDVANEAAFIKSNTGNLMATIGFKF